MARAVPLSVSPSHALARLSRGPIALDASSPRLFSSGAPSRLPLAPSATATATGRPVESSRVESSRVHDPIDRCARTSWWFARVASRRVDGRDSFSDHDPRGSVGVEDRVSFEWWFDAMGDDDGERCAIHGDASVVVRGDDDDRRRWRPCPRRDRWAPGERARGRRRGR